MRGGGSIGGIEYEFSFVGAGRLRDAGRICGASEQREGMGKCVGVRKGKGGNETRGLGLEVGVGVGEGLGLWLGYEGSAWGSGFGLAV